MASSDLRGTGAAAMSEQMDSADDDLELTDELVRDILVGKCHDIPALCRDWFALKSQRDAARAALLAAKEVKPM